MSLAHLSSENPTPDDHDPRCAAERDGRPTPDDRRPQARRRTVAGRPVLEDHCHVERLTTRLGLAHNAARETSQRFVNDTLRARKGRKRRFVCVRAQGGQACGGAARRNDEGLPALRSLSRWPTGRLRAARTPASSPSAQGRARNVSMRHRRYPCAVAQGKVLARSEVRADDGRPLADEG